jgi:membrane protein implicated in regulation of membrane protease activity
MLEWFSDLTSFQKIYWIITGISTLLFLVVLIGTFMGADTDDLGDIDAEMDADTGVGFQFFTFKNTVAFFAIFGWSGISALDAGYSKPITIIISMICGLLMMTLMGVLFFYMRKLNDSGTLKMTKALNAIGEVYLTVGANRSSIGKVQVKVQGALRELEALTDYNTDLKQGNVVKVIEVTDNGILIIEPQKK